MKTLVPVLSALAALAVAGVSAGVPSCDAKMIEKMSSLYPNGPHTDILKTLQEQGPLSYVWVSQDEASVAGVKPSCIGISVKDKQVSATYNMRGLPITKNFPVEESRGYLTQTDGSTTYRVYFSMDKDNGVVCTYRCCNTFSETGSGIL